MDFELPCPHCASMLPAPQLQAHIKAEHGGAAAALSSGGEPATREKAQPAAASSAGEKPKPKLNPPRKQLAAFAALKEAVKEANKSVKAARKAGMPDASRAPPSEAAGRGGSRR
ncbi:hypothetical protein ABPG77_009689 [Micractinium sp. CCAP 211/92]